MDRNTLASNVFMQLLSRMGRVDDTLQLFERIITTQLPEFLKPPVVYQDVVSLLVLMHKECQRMFFSLRLRRIRWVASFLHLVRRVKFEVNFFCISE